MSTITIYRATNLNLEVDISGIDDLSGYTCHFIVKKLFSSTENAIDEDTDVLNGTVFSFAIGYAKTDIANGKYVFEVAVSNNGQRHVVTQGIFMVEKTLKW